MRHFTDKHTRAQVVAWLMFHAKNWVHDGYDTPNNRWMMDLCTAAHRPSGAILILTREQGYHSSGWWKNPDYERCWHLSLSFRDPETGEHRARDKKESEQWIDEVFGATKTLLWIEPPFGPEGKHADVWHYRVFYAPGWEVPILPRKEVYSRDFTPAGFLSWSDLRAKEAEEEKQTMERMMNP